MERYLKAGIAGIAGILILALAVGFLVGPGAPLEETIARSYNTNVYREQGGNKLVVASGGEIEVQSGGTFDLQSGAAVTGDADVSGEVQAGTFLNFTAATSITATNGNPITATASYQPITAAGEVTPTIETSGFTAGDVLTLINTSAQTINIADTGNQVLSAAAALGQYDVLALWFDGTRWIEISRSDN